MNEKTHPIHLKVGVNFHTPHQARQSAVEKIHAKLDRARADGQDTVRLTARDVKTLRRRAGLVDGDLLCTEKRKLRITADRLAELLETVEENNTPKTARTKPFTLPRWALVVDTETASTATPTMPGFEDWQPEGQALLFGRALLARHDGMQYVPRREFLFYPDDLPEQGVAALKDGMRARIAGMAYETDDPPHLPLVVQPLSEFLDTLYTLALRRRAYIVGFNLPFGLSRLAFDVTYAAGDMSGGFSFALWHGEDGQAHPFRPRLRVRRLDNVKAFFQMEHPSRREKGRQWKVPAHWL